MDVVAVVLMVVAVALSWAPAVRDDRYPALSFAAFLALAAGFVAFMLDHHATAAALTAAAVAQQVVVVARDRRRGGSIAG